MDLILVFLPVAVALVIARRADEQQRVALLGGHLRPLHIEQHMEQLTETYLRALGEPDPARAEAIWQNLAATENALQDELRRLADALQDVWGERMRVSRWAIGVPHATRFFPQASFDFRALVALHAQGFADVLRLSLIHI